jgi:hypothetical protein
MAAYYALHHPANRVSLHGLFPRNGGPSGFLAVAHTGLDLFRPRAVPFVAHPIGLACLLRAGLAPSRPVVLHLPVEQRSWAESVVELSEAQVWELLRFDPRAFQPVINVHMTETKTPGGWPRHEIRSGQSVVAAAGLNWKGERYAEVYVEAVPAARDRSLTKSVLTAVVGKLLSERKVALYRVLDGDTGALEEALEVGFRPTGVRTVVAQALLREPA